MKNNPSLKPTADELGAIYDAETKRLEDELRATFEPDKKFHRLMMNLTIGPPHDFTGFGPLIYNYSETKKGNFVYEQEVPGDPQAPQHLTITNKELKSLNKPGKPVKLGITKYKGSDIHLTLIQHP